MSLRPRAAISWSGGKDSCTAFEWAKDEFEIVAGLTMVDESGARSRSHGVRVDLLRQQTNAMGIDHVTRRCDWSSYEQEFIDGLSELRSDYGVSHVIYGDIVYPEHRASAERFASAARLSAVEPLWGIPTLQVVQRFLQSSGRALIVTVSARCLDSTWLGTELNTDSVRRLMELGVDPCGENGEYHTFVTDSPSFMAPVQVEKGEIVSVRGCWALDLRGLKNLVPGA
jgi:diphthine-ammonia ligase